MDQLYLIIDQILTLVFTHIQEIVAAAIGLMFLKIRTKVIEYFNRDAINSAADSAFGEVQNLEADDDTKIKNFIEYIKDTAPDAVAKIKPELIPVILAAKYMSRKLKKD